MMFIRQKLLKHKCTQNVTDIVFLLCIKFIFFWFHRSVGFKANIEYTKKGIKSAMEFADVQLSLSLRIHEK